MWYGLSVVFFVYEEHTRMLSVAHYLLASILSIIKSISVYGLHVAASL